MTDSTFRLTRLGGSSAEIPSDASTFRLTRLAASGVGGGGNDSTFRLTRLSGSSAGAGSTYRLTRLAASGGIPTGLRAVLVPDRVIEAVRDTYLDASMSQGSWDANNVQWQQTADSRQGAAFNPANPTVPVVGSGPTVVIRPQPAKQNYTLSYRVIITDGVNQSTATTNLIVYEWLFWEADAASWVPQFEYLLEEPVIAPPPPPPPPQTPGVSTMPTFGFTSAATGQIWDLAYTEDFLTPIGVGGFTTMTTGDTGKLNPASPGGAVYAASFKAKTEGSPDTSGNAVYSAIRTLSVENVPNATGVARIWLHKDGTQAVGGAIKPLIPGGAPGPDYLGYCRVEVRAKQTLIQGPGFGCVNLLINPNQWAESVEGYGEDDWWESQLGGPVKGHRHPTHPIGVADSSVPIDGGGRVTTDWHRYVIEWFPQGTGGRVRYLIDDQVVFDTTDRVATAPRTLGYLIQAGSNGFPVPDGAEGYLDVDWIAIWKRRP